MKKEKNHKLYRKMGFYERYIKRAIDIFILFERKYNISFVNHFYSIRSVDTRRS